MAVSELRCDFEAFDSDRITVHAVETERAEQRVRGRVSLFGHDGREVVRLSGVELAEIRRADGGERA